MDPSGKSGPAVASWHAAKDSPSPSSRRLVITALVVVILVVGLPGGWLLYQRVVDSPESYWCRVLQPVFSSRMPFGSQRYNDSCREVWLTFQVPVSIRMNFLQFSLEFKSDEGAKGILTVTFDDTIVGTIREEQTAAGIQEIKLPVESKSPGEYNLGLRLVPTTKTKSLITVKDIGVGYDPSLVPATEEIADNARVIAELVTVADSASFSPDKSQVIVTSFAEFKRGTAIPSECELCSGYDRIDQAGYVATPSGDELYFVGQKYEGEYFVYRGQASGPFELNQRLEISFDDEGTNYALVAHRGESMVVIKNGEEILLIDRRENNQSIGEISLSPNGDRLAYTVSRGSGKDHSTTVSITGEADQVYRNVAGFRFSPDGQHYVFIAEDDTGVFLVYDGQKNESYTEINRLSIAYPPITFSRDSDSTMYVASRGGQVSAADSTEYLVVNGKEVATHTEITEYYLSPDGHLTSYIGIDFDAQQPGNEVYGVYVNGELKYQHSVPQDIFKRQVSQLTVSPDGTSIAYVLELDNDIVAVVLNGQQQAGYLLVNDLQFSPDGTRLAYNAAGQDYTPLVVVDGNQLPGYSPFRPFAFSPDSQHFAYWSSPPREKYPFRQTGDDTESFKGQSYVVVDDVAGPLFDDLYDGNQEAFSLVADESGLPRINSIIFSETGDQVIYNARQGKALLEVIVGVP